MYSKIKRHLLLEILEEKKSFISFPLAKQLRVL